MLKLGLLHSEVFPVLRWSNRHAQTKSCMLPRGIGLGTTSEFTGALQVFAVTRRNGEACWLQILGDKPKIVTRADRRRVSEDL